MKPFPDGMRGAAGETISSGLLNLRYSKHLQIRLALRKIDHDLPRRIFEQASERFSDAETGHTIAVGKAWLYEKERDVIVAYTLEGEDAKLLTIHPLQEGQKENSITSGR